MNSTLTIGPLSGTIVSDDNQVGTSAEQTIFEREATPTRNAIHLQWSSFRIEELFESVLAIFTFVYLIGALGLGGMLLFYTLHH